MKRLLFLLTLASCDKEFPDWFGCDKPDKFITTAAGDTYSRDGCWEEAGRHCCHYTGVNVPCEQTACSTDCRNYSSDGIECEEGMWPFGPPVETH